MMIDEPNSDWTEGVRAKRSLADEVGVDAGGGVSLTGRSIGNYHIEGELGRGGMGVVYEARQHSPSRRVALKVIRPGVASPAVLRRFEQEAQVLGRLQHAGIAQIYEAGTFDAGLGVQPFFAMEFVEGEPLTQYAYRRSLGTRERLALIVKVCQAVAHAHQKGVIHRDLKPANILVVDVEEASGTGQSATPYLAAQPKVLDFGVARATDGDVQTATLQTDIGQLIGTVPYMSPEQAGGDPNELDTRSDVYALGVIAYELLVGRLPYDLRQKMIHEAVRIIREEEPTRLSSIDRTLRGDVEILVGKALAKEKERRYQTASDFASDIERYLHDEPIVARPPSAAYQFRKFAQRNKALVGGLAATLVVLMGGLIGTSYGLAQAVQARDRETQQRQVAEASEQRAIEEAERAEREAERALAAESETKQRADELELVAEFQASQLRNIETELMGTRLRDDILSKRQAYLESGGHDEEATAAALAALSEALIGVNFTNVALQTLDENIFERALAAIEEKFGDQPLVKARLLQTVADTLQALGLFQRATAPQVEALEIRRRVLEDEHPDTLRSISNMGILLKAQGKLSEAEPYYREALESSRRVLGDEHPDTLGSINNMGALLYAQGKPAEAEPYAREALEGCRRVLAAEHPDTLNSINNMGALLKSQGKLADAEPYYREALEIRRRVLGDAHPDTLSSINNVGALLRDQGKLADAEPYAREALEGRRGVLGDEHPDTLGSINNMGILLRAQNKLDEAEPYYREALEGFRRVLGDEHPTTLTSIGSLGLLLRAQGKLAEAEPCYREALEGQRRVLGDEHPGTLISINNMGFLLRLQGKLAEAELYWREALEVRRRLLGDEHPDTLLSIGNMGVLLRDQGKLADAEQYYREALAGRRRVLGDEHPDTLVSINNMGPLLRDQGKLADAEWFSRQALEGYRRVLGDEHPHTLLSMQGLGKTLVALQKWDEAKVLCLECYDRNEKRYGAAHTQTRGAIKLLIELYEAWHTAEPDAGHELSAEQWRAKLPPPSEGSPAGQ